MLSGKYWFLNVERRDLSGWVNYMDQRFYPDHPSGWDDLLYLEAIKKCTSSEDRILDIGAGRGANPRIALRGFVNRVCGIDVGDEVCENTYLDEAKKFDGLNIPYPANYFDCVVSSYVLEHLDNPKTVFGEASRVLKPGGAFVFRTPNRTHYVPLIASITPQRFHEYVNKRRGRKEEDTFPTFYRANTAKQIKALATNAGLEVISISLVDGRPEYLRFNALTYFFGLVYQRVNSMTECLNFLRPLIIGTLRKQHHPPV